MHSVENQLTEMSREFESRSKTKVVLETGLYTLVLLSLLVGNFLTLFIISFNRQMRTVPNMLVASLAVTDFLLGLLSVSPLGVSTLAASKWPFDDTACQYQGYMAVTLAVASTQLLALMAVNRYFHIVSPAKYRRYFTWKKNYHYDSGRVVLLHLGSLALPAQRTQDGISPFQVFLLSSDRRRSIHGLHGDCLHWITNLCYLLLLPKNIPRRPKPQH